MVNCSFGSSCTYLPLCEFVFHSLWLCMLYSTTVAHNRTVLVNLISGKRRKSGMSVDHFGQCIFKNANNDAFTLMIPYRLYMPFKECLICM